MKKIKKIVSLLLVMAMMFAMTTTAFATEANLSGHTYKAYQIFSGTQAEGSAELGQIVWGRGVNEENLLAELKEKGTAYDDCSTAASVAEVLAGFGEDSDAARAFAKVAYENIVSSEGIAVENGKTDLAAGYYLVVDTTAGSVDTYNLALLQLTNKGTFEIKNKTSVPTMDKKVKDTNDTTEETTNWQDSADYDIGDAVPFKLTATLGTNLKYFDTYKVVFHDTLSEGLTYNNDAKFYIDGTEIKSGFEPSTTNGLTFTCDDVKVLGAKDNSIITVEYTATLNEKAVIGSAGNPNTAYLEYSNNPNVSGGGDKHPTGNTPEDKVIVFTYKVVVDKYTKDKDGKEISLKGAGFTLSKKNSEGVYVPVGEEVKGTDLTRFVWEGLDDGDYKLEETTVPLGYNKAADVTFTIFAEHDTNSDNPQLTTLSAGTLVTGEVSTGTLYTKVENNKGAILPSTGGIGTTVFYVAGIVMMFGAAVSIYSRKREEF